MLQRGPSALLSDEATRQPCSTRSSSGSPPSSAPASSRSSAAPSTARRPRPRARSPGRSPLKDFKAGFSLDASTPALVAQLQSQLALDPKDEHSWVLLGLAYQQRARETGDPTYYAKSGGALHTALSLKADDELVYSGLGSLALSRHRFREALALGRAGARAHRTTRATTA